MCLSDLSKRHHFINKINVILFLVMPNTNPMQISIFQKCPNKLSMANLSYFHVKNQISVYRHFFLLFRKPHHLICSLIHGFLKRHALKYSTIFSTILLIKVFEPRITFLTAPYLSVGMYSLQVNRAIHAMQLLDHLITSTR